MKAKRRIRQLKTRNTLLILVIISIFILCEYILLFPTKEPHHEEKNKPYYTNKDFHIKLAKSHHDQNKNKKDDLKDLQEGELITVKEDPDYVSGYYEGGYPPKGEGVCTDVIWKAFKNAGYNLKDMVDYDISQRPKDYKHIEKPDPSIDFRRVPTLQVFFEKYAKSLTTNLHKIDKWQPGDIVLFGDQDHIGMISNKRNKEGIPYMIHHGSKEQEQKEQDILLEADSRMTITKHYRFIYNKQIKELLKNIK